MTAMKTRFDVLFILTLVSVTLSHQYDVKGGSFSGSYSSSSAASHSSSYSSSNSASFSGSGSFNDIGHGFKGLLGKFSNSAANSGSTALASSNSGAQPGLYGTIIGSDATSPSSSYYNKAEAGSSAGTLGATSGSDASVNTSGFASNAGATTGSSTFGSDANNKNSELGSASGSLSNSGSISGTGVPVYGSNQGVAGVSCGIKNKNCGTSSVGSSDATASSGTYSGSTNLNLKPSVSTLPATVFGYFGSKPLRSDAGSSSSSSEFVDGKLITIVNKSTIIPGSSGHAYSETGKYKTPLSGFVIHTTTYEGPDATKPLVTYGLSNPIKPDSANTRTGSYSFVTANSKANADSESQLSGGAVYSGTQPSNIKRPVDYGAGTASSGNSYLGIYGTGLTYSTTQKPLANYYGGSIAGSHGVSGSYGTQNTNVAGTKKLCCQGPFPGPNGSIYDSKPAASVPAVPIASGAVGSGSFSSGGSFVPFPGPNGNIYDSKPVSSGSSAVQNSNYPSSGSQVIGVTYVKPSFPGPQGSIYGSKPAVPLPTPAVGTNTETSTVYKPCCKGPFPGPNGSIHDSKPASAVTPVANTGTYWNTQWNKGPAVTKVEQPTQNLSPPSIGINQPGLVDTSLGGSSVASAGSTTGSLSTTFDSTGLVQAVETPGSTISPTIGSGSLLPQPVSNSPSTLGYNIHEVVKQPEVSFDGTQTQSTGISSAGGDGFATGSVQIQKPSSFGGTLGSGLLHEPGSGVGKLDVGASGTLQGGLGSVSTLQGGDSGKDVSGKSGTNFDAVYDSSGAVAGAHSSFTTDKVDSYGTHSGSHGGLGAYGSAKDGLGHGAEGGIKDGFYGGSGGYSSSYSGSGAFGGFKGNLNDGSYSNAGSTVGSFGGSIGDSLGKHGLSGSFASSGSGAYSGSSSFAKSSSFAGSSSYSSSGSHYYSSH